jgi:hypothetical protein
MYIVNGIAYAEEIADEIELNDVAVLDDMILLLTFNTNEKRIYDAAELLKCPAFKPLEDREVFNAVKIEQGVATWLDGKIDIAPEKLYTDSYRYQEPLAL